MKGKPKIEYLGYNWVRFAENLINKEIYKPLTGFKFGQLLQVKALHKKWRAFTLLSIFYKRIILRVLRRGAPKLFPI